MSAIAHAKKPSNVGSPQRESWGRPSVASSKGMSNRPPTSGDMTWPLRVIPCQTGFPLGSTKATLDWDGASLPVSSGCSVQKNPLECWFHPTCADVLGLPNTCPPSWLGRSASRWMAAERRSVERQCWVSPTLSIVQDSGFLPPPSLPSHFILFRLLSYLPYSLFYLTSRAGEPVVGTHPRRTSPAFCGCPVSKGALWFLAGPRVGHESDPWAATQQHAVKPAVHASLVDGK